MSCSQIPYLYLSYTESLLQTVVSGNSCSMNSTCQAVCVKGLFFFLNFYSNIVDLQCCVSLSCTAKWVSYIYICVCVCARAHVCVVVVVESLSNVWLFVSLYVAMCLIAQLCPTLCDPMNCTLSGSSVLGDSLGKNTGVGCHSLLQGIFPTQGLNPGLLHCRQIFYHLSHQGSPYVYIHIY